MGQIKSEAKVLTPKVNNLESYFQGLKAGLRELENIAVEPKSFAQGKMDLFRALKVFNNTPRLIEILSANNFHALREVATIYFEMYQQGKDPMDQESKRVDLTKCSMPKA